MWKPEYAARRRAKYQSDESERAKRMEQSAPNKAARAEYMKSYVQAKPEKFKRTPEQQAKVNEARRKKYAEDAEYRDKMKEIARQRHVDNPIAKKKQHLKKYGLTPECLSKMLDACEHKCEICGHSEKRHKMFPMIDHCHTSGKVRGILCSNCNMGIGKFKDNPELLQAAIAYLKKNQSSSGAT